MRNVHDKRRKAMRDTSRHPANRQFKEQAEAYDQANANNRNGSLMLIAKRIYWAITFIAAIVIVILFLYYMAQNVKTTP